MNAKLDFLRLATWDITAHTKTLSKIMLGWPGEWERGKWLQYKGWRKAQFFMGHGEQNSKWHGVISCSGSLAHKMQNSLARCDEFYATRLDVQVTIPKPDGLSLPALREEIGHKGTSLISSEENDTLYLGSRTSELFTRLYEKPLDKMYLRLEFELKSSRAKSAWAAIQAGEVAHPIFDYYLDRSKLPGDVKAHFIDADSESTLHAMNAEIAADNQKSLKWIQSLDASMMKNMGNHEIGEQVREIIRAWAVYSNNIDSEAHHLYNPNVRSIN